MNYRTSRRPYKHRYSFQTPPRGRSGRCFAWIRFALVVGLGLSLTAALSLNEDVPESNASESSLASLLSETYLPSVVREKMKLVSTPSGELRFAGVPASLRESEQKVEGYSVHLTVDPDLQVSAEEILEEYRVPYGAIVALEPGTGDIKALASHCSFCSGSGYTARNSGEKSGADILSSAGLEEGAIALRSGFPAASLFKIISAAAALEKSNILPETNIKYRGGDYTLNRYNYKPMVSRDKRAMTLELALAKSCNPVFARIALQHLSPHSLSNYAERFGFNTSLSADVPVMDSTFSLTDDSYSFARTAAGFGDVTISPLHAATVMATIVAGGQQRTPRLLSHITDKNGRRIYTASEASARQVLLPSTAEQLRDMLVLTTQRGTARRYFRSARLRNMEIPGKTGTLSGDNPKGRYYWFVGATPESELAVAALVIDPGGARINGTGLGKRFFEHYFSRPAKPLA